MQKGYLLRRNQGTTIESFMTDTTHTGICTNTDRIAEGVIDWILSEELCDFDFENHTYLATNVLSESAGYFQTQSYPESGTIQYTEPEPGTSVTAAELINPAAGEDIDDDVAACMEDDYCEPSEKQKREILKIHRGLGHPAPNELGRALRHAGAHRHLIRWAVKEMRCPVCEGRVRPAARRPGTLPRCLRFNQVIGIDLVEFPDNHYDKILCNIVCWGTGYQMACVMPDKTSKTTRDAFANLWIKHYSWPELIVTDQGPEFTGHEFSSYVGEHGTLQHFIDSQSPWQQGRTERAGDSLKGNLRAVIEECAIVTDAEFDLALSAAVDARNRYVNRSGFSAHQRVFGSALRLPGSLLSDDFVDRMAVSTDPTSEFARSAEIRDSAQKALFKNADSSALHAAAIARSRVQPKYDLKGGSIVYVWRSSPRAKIRGWVGPGLVVCLNEKQSSAWVSMRGVLIKTNTDRIRPATDTEWLGAELIKVLSEDAKAHIERKGQRGYVDATAEEGPGEDDLPPAVPETANVVPYSPLATIPEEGVPVHEDVVMTQDPPIQSASSSSSVDPTSVIVEPPSSRPRTMTQSSVQSEPAAEPSRDQTPEPRRGDDRTLAEAAREATANAASSRRQTSRTPSARSDSDGYTPAGGWIQAEQ